MLDDLIFKLAGCCDFLVVVAAWFWFVVIEVKE